MQHFYSFVSQVWDCWCPPFSAHHVEFLLICLHFYSFVSQVCHCWCPPFSAGHVAFLFICLPGLSLLSLSLSLFSLYVLSLPLSLSLSSLLSLSLSLFSSLSPLSPFSACPPFSAGHLAFLFICPPLVRPFPLALQHLSPRSVTAFLFICLPGLSLLAPALFRWPFRISIHLSPRSVLLVSALFRRRCNISIHSQDSLLLGVLNSALSLLVAVSALSPLLRRGPTPIFL